MFRTHLLGALVAAALATPALAQGVPSGTAGAGWNDTTGAAHQGGAAPVQQWGTAPSQQWGSHGGAVATPWGTPGEPLPRTEPYRAPNGPTSPYAAPPTPTQPNGRLQATTYKQSELIEAGQAFFGQASADLAAAIQHLLGRFGEPNGYILGEEGAGAVFAGLRYGEGQLFTRQMGIHDVFWQGPSMGFDLGGSGSRVMMLVYELPSVPSLMQRFTGVDGSAYFFGGLSVTLMAADTTYLIPVRTGIGARLGVSLGYLKFTATPTWNPF